MLFGFVYRFPLVVRKSAPDIVQYTDLATQGDLKLFESFGFAMGVSAGLHHGLMSILDRIHVFAQTSSKDFRFAGANRIADEA